MTRKTTTHNEPPRDPVALSYTRVYNFLDDLARLPCSDVLTDSEAAAVVDLMLKHRISDDDFRYMDEQPGAIGYDYGKSGTGWHWKLRQVRNRSLVGQTCARNEAALRGETYQDDEAEQASQE